MIIRFSGGLGNQMFQFAYLFAQKKRYPNERVVADIGDFDTTIHHNGYEIESIFSLDIPKCSDIEKESHRIKNALPYRIIRKLGFKQVGLPKRIVDLGVGFDEQFIGNFEDTDFLWGYWQSERYFIDFKDEIKSLFTFPKITDTSNKTFFDSINNSNSVAVHIRRGDYQLFSSLGFLSDTDYYARAIEVIRETDKAKKHWFIFSDDIKWCKMNLPLDGETVTYVSNNTGDNSFRDMQLMSMCNYIIVANSTFSWWGAWLANNKKYDSQCEKEQRNIIIGKMTLNQLIQSHIANRLFEDDFLQIMKYLFGVGNLNLRNNIVHGGFGYQNYYSPAVASVLYLLCTVVINDFHLKSIT